MEPKKPALSSKSGSEKKSRPWRPTKRQVLWIIGMVVALLTTALLTLNLYPEIWKGLLEERNLKLIVIGVSVTAIIVLLAIGGAASRWTGFRGMTVRDWLPIVGALLIPVAVAAGTWGITWQQGKIEDRRAEADRKLAEQRAEDEALQAYLDQMNTLLLEHNLRNSKEDSGVRTLARARTLTVLERLHPSRKTAVMQFLVEADLVQRPVLCAEEGCGIDPDDPIIRPIITLSNAELSKVDVVNYADLIEADFSDADLSDADLSHANLSGAAFYDADLSHADLSETDLSVATSAWSEVGIVPGRPKFHAGLSGANLRGADLKGADLKGAYLDDADLKGANLKNAYGWTEDQLSKAETLADATVPNGQKYEDWLKDREKRQRDE